MGAVPRRYVVEIFDRLEAAAAGHVHWHDRRIAGDMPAQELRGEPAVDVVAAAGTVADDHAHGLAAIEVGDRIGAQIGSDDEHGGERRGPPHGSPGEGHGLPGVEAAPTSWRHVPRGRSRFWRFSCSYSLRKVIGPPSITACICSLALTSV